MANRFWVGGTATWDTTAGTKWATTSGGAGGASVPTSADDVFFDANSGTVTCTVGAAVACRNLDFTGFTGTFAGNNTVGVNGTVFTVSSGMTYTHNSQINFNAASNTVTVTTNGKTITSNVGTNASGSVMSLADAYTASGTISIGTGGSFYTNNFAVSAASMSISGGGSGRTIDFGSSVLTFSSSTGISFAGSGYTFNSGTSQINLTAANATLAGGGQTFYNVAFTSIAGGNTRVITGANTFNNLSVTAPSSPGVAQVSFNNNQTINGTLSTTGTAGNKRVWFRSDTYGVRRTLTINGSTSLTDADFRDIIVNGIAAPISGTRIGNRGQCSGITFDAPKTVYWVGSAGGDWGENGRWATTSGGATSNDNFPLPQDTAIIENTGLATGFTIQLNQNVLGYVPNVDCSTRTNAMTFNVGNTTVYGSWTNGSGVSFTGTSTLTFSGEGTKTITSAGKTFTCPITIDAYGGTVELADALNIGNNLTVTNGTFDTKNFNVTLSGIISSDNSNVRTIKLGSSTITSSSNSTMFWFANSTNLTFDSGTSQVTLTDGSGALTNASGVVTTFYNVTFTGASFAGQRLIVGSCIFNNLTFNVSGGTNTMSETSFGANQVVNGTLTVTGTTALRRVMFLSNTVGTPRTLTVNTLVADDCDFRDITIAGSAAGASPTRAGDCGGNSGITFPSPKTVYRVGTNTSWVGSSSWATTSGGTGDNNNFPLAQDTAVIDNNTALSGTLELVGAFFKFNVGSLDMSSRTNAITLNFDGNATAYFAGSVTFGSGITITGTGNSLFTGRGTMTFTSAGKTIPFRITADSFSGTFQLGDAFNSSNSLTLTSGTLDAVTYNVTCSVFNSSNANVRTLKMGSGLWTLSGSGGTPVWNTQTATNLTFFKDTADILLSDTSTTARTFNGGGLSYNKLTIGGTTGTSTLTIAQNNQFTELASTKTVAHTIALGTTNQTFGAWTVTGSAGNVVTLTGTGTSHQLAGSCTSGIDYLAMGSIGFASFSLAEFYAGANSTGTAAAPVYRTATPSPRTLYWVGGTGNWSDTARWSLASGGAGGAALPTSLDNVVFDSASNATAYTATVDATTRCNQLTIAGPASGNVTLAGGAALITHGNVTLPATGLTRTYTGGITLSGSTTGKTFTANVQLNNALTVSGVGCGWTLGSALNMAGSQTLNVANGSFDTANFNLTAPSLSSNNANTRSITLGSSTVVLNNNGGIGFATSTNLTFSAGTSQINLSNTGATLNGGGQTFNNVSFTSTSFDTVSITGSNTFNNLTFTGRTSYALNAQNRVLFSGNQTINGTLTFSPSTNGRFRTLFQSDTGGVARTLTCANASLSDINIVDITIAGAAAPVSGTRLGDCGGNSGITFPAPKTVYWNNVGGGDWTTNAWALTSGGAVSYDNFPLPQDTIIFDNTGLGSGSASIGSANIVNITVGTIDCSQRTLGTLSFNNNINNLNLCGDLILRSNVSFANIGGVNMIGRGKNVNFGLNGGTFDNSLLINTINGSVTLLSALTINRVSWPAFLHGVGTLICNGYNVTLTGGNSAYVVSGTGVRGVSFGGSTWTLQGDANGNGSRVWDASTSTNMTITGSGTINLTSGSAKTFSGGSLNYSGITINQGGTGTLTFEGNNTLGGITDTVATATTIALGTTTQRVGAFTVTGTVGNVVTITGTTSNLIYTGAGSISGLDYLNIQGRAYGSAGQITGIWNAGTNSVNSGSLGWDFAAAPPPPPAANANFFLLFA